MPLPDFHVSEPFTLGIELEMQVVNPPGYDLSQDSSMLIDAVKNKITANIEFKAVLAYEPKK
ncbi:TPA: hypothetical protein HMU46_14515 [Escherichia coli]|nr:hypothetical protein [Escherichia coli]